MNNNSLNAQKVVNLNDLILKPFKGKGRCVTMEGNYMNEIMTLIGHYELRMYFVGYRKNVTVTLYKRACKFI